MKFLYFLSVGRPLCCQAYLGILAAFTWYMDVVEPGCPSSCVMDPRCFLCDLFLPLFLQQDRDLGIWHIATCHVALMSQFLMCCCISFISACAYVSWRRSSSCCVVFRFVRYVVGYVVLFVLLTITRLRPMSLGCCAKLADDVVCGVLLVWCVTQLNIGIFVFGW
jgi:hypothetical protein